MELRHLKYFIAVAEELNFSRAAERLHIAQPPLSQQIRDLEEYLEVKLFDRKERPVRLTDAGVELLEQSRAIFERLDEVVNNVRRIGKGQTGSIRIGFVGSATYAVLPEIFRAFRKKFPAVQLGLLELRAHVVLEKIRHREIDIGFIRQFNDDEAFVCTKIVEEPLVVALPANHELAKRDQIELSELAGEPFIGFSAATTGYGGYLLKVCQEAGFRPNIVQETVEIQTAVSLISSGYGLTLAPDSLRRVRREGVVYRPLAAPTPLAYLFSVHRRNNQSPVLQSFLGLMSLMLNR